MLRFIWLLSLTCCLKRCVWLWFDSVLAFIGFGRRIFIDAGVLAFFLIILIEVRNVVQVVDGCYVSRSAYGCLVHKTELLTGVCGVAGKRRGLSISEFKPRFQSTRSDYWQPISTPNCDLGLIWKPSKPRTQNWFWIFYKNMSIPILLIKWLSLIQNFI